MGLKGTTKEKLDRFGPYGSGIGAFIGVVLMFLNAPLPYPFLIFAYLFCTCTHRKYLIYSPGAVGGFIGAFIGYIISCLLLFFTAMMDHASVHQLSPMPLELIRSIFFTILMIIPIFSFLFSRYFCRRAKKKEIQRNQVTVK